jgi:cellulose synthase/poly-beta-1,6-N-acetylglucosamine synthase-like glycosyltransferase
MPSTVALIIIGVAVALVAYTYVGYPLLVALIATLKRKSALLPLVEWPRISITVPAYNEERELAATLEALLELDYPEDRREILVVSDASTDRTDEIARSYAHRGIKLIRMEQRSGKTAAENAASQYLTGDIVVNTDASIRIGVDSLKPLIRQFTDPTVGVASGRDVSIARTGSDVNPGESKYVGYEMLLRSWETRAGGIIGASGCLYAIRAHLHRTRLADGLSRDFAAALVSRQHGYRAVSVDDAICYVPRTASLKREYHRKVRTMTRGMETLFALRTVLNPLNYGMFSWMLFSHKICRWGVPWAALFALIALLALAPSFLVAKVLAIAALAGIALGSFAFTLPENQRLSRLLSTPAYLLMGNVAAIHASLRALHGDKNAVWEPTRREAAPA